MKKNSLYLLRFLVCVSITVSSCNTSAQKKLNAEQWQEDLQFMAKELEAKHLNLYHTTSKEQFNIAVQQLNDLIPSLEDYEVIVEMARLTAMIGDGHSGIRLASDKQIAFRSFPIRIYHYSDGFFVDKISRKHAQLAGAQLVKIGDTDIEEVYDILQKLIPLDNDQYSRLYAPYFMASPEILHATGIIKDMEKAQFYFKQEGKQIEISMSPEGELMLTGEVLTDSGMSNIDLVSVRDNTKAPSPLWLKQPKENKFWFEYIAEEKMVYVQINEMKDKQDQTIANFAQQIFAFIDENLVENFVYDLRWNRGGDNTLIYPLITGVIRANSINQRGNFFTIIGRQTFSAGQSLVNELEKYTNVLFVGEPTASHVNFYSDSHKIYLPNSKIKVRASFVLEQKMHYLDNRIWTQPHILAALSSEDYRNNIDPAMNAILNYSSR